jgi:hypothetical protein
VRLGGVAWAGLPATFPAIRSRATLHRGLPWDERMPPLAFTSEEIATLADLASPLPPARRTAFFEAVALELAHHPERGPGTAFLIGGKLQVVFLRPSSSAAPPRPPLDV